MKTSRSIFGSFFLAALLGAGPAHPSILNGGCGNVDEAAAQSALRRIRACATVGSATSNFGAIADLSEKVNVTAEDRFFELSGRKNSRELRCAADFADKIAAGDAKALPDVIAKLRLLRAARGAWVNATKELRQDRALAGRMCPTFQEELSSLDNVTDHFRDVCTRVIHAKSAVAAIQAAIPLSSDDRVRKIADDYANAASEETAGDLGARVRRAFAESAKDLRTNAIEMSARLASPGGPKFSANEKRSLVADPLLVEEIVATDRASLAPIACRADFRYGERGDDVAAAVTLGTWAIGGTVVGALKGATLAANLVRAAAVARTSGRISLVATRILQGAAFATTSVTAFRDVERVCGTRRTSVSAKAGACLSAPSVERLAEDNCKLGWALSGLNVAAALPAGSLAMLAPAMRSASDLEAFARFRSTTATTEGWYERRVKERLGYVPKLEIETSERLGGTGNDIRAYDKSGREIGEMMADTDGEKVKVVWYEVTKEAARDKGVAGVMFAKFMEVHPDQKIVKAELDEVNKSVVTANLAKGMTCEQAVLDSPAGKMLGRFGFAKFASPPDCTKRIFIELSR